VILVRHAYLPDVTLGWLAVFGHRFATLERPWLPAEGHKGGKARVSCVPDGTYDLRPHSGPRFKNVWALVNSSLDVHHYPAGPGRSAILIHAGNTVYDVVGCIAIGVKHGDFDGKPAVIESRTAIEKLREVLGGRLPCLQIRPTRGTAEMFHEG
jgi:hypothetical protein